jgi:cell division septum initiation protein DivIVA
MMRYPAAYRNLLDIVRANIEEGATTAAEGVKQLAGEIQRDATAWAENDLGAALAKSRAAASKAAAIERSGQETLYPELRAVYKITPSQSKVFGDFTERDCETALRVIDNQKQDRDRYVALVREVLPFLGGDKTVRDIWAGVQAKREESTP